MAGIPGLWPLGGGARNSRAGWSPQIGNWIGALILLLYIEATGMSASFVTPALHWCSNPLQWRHNEHHGVSNHRRFDCSFNHLCRRRSKERQTSASLAFERGIHRWPVNSPHKGPVTLKMLPFDDFIVIIEADRVAGEIFLYDAISRNCDVLSFVYHIETETKWPPFRRRHFQMHFLEWKLLNFE